MADTQIVAAAAEQLWPANLAEEWDAPGFSVHTPSDVSRVLLSVDVTATVVSEAIAKGCQMVLSHHPFLLRGTKDVNFDGLKGHVVQLALANHVSLFAAHTNADVVEQGVSAALAGALELRDTVPLVPTLADSKIGHGRIGTLDNEITLKDLAARLAATLPFSARGVTVAGDPEASVSLVAVCGGAGDSLITAAFDAGADVFITSDLRHHVTLDAISTPRSDPFACIDISHWAAESLWLQTAASQLASLVSDVEFLVSEVTTDPWQFQINKGSL
jgi:dinuclear metal center YbgI/SA1388 family protein